MKKTLPFIVVWLAVTAGGAIAEQLSRPPGVATSPPIASTIPPAVSRAASLAIAPGIKPARAGETAPEFTRPSDADQAAVQLRPPPPGTELPIRPVEPDKISQDLPLKPGNR